MKARNRSLEQEDLLRVLALGDLIDSSAIELVKLAALDRLGVLDQEWAGFFPSKRQGRPIHATATGGWLWMYLQHLHRAAPMRAVIDRLGLSNPYFQYFTGKNILQHRPPIPFNIFLSVGR